MLRKITFPISVFVIWRVLILIFQIFIQPIYLLTWYSQDITRRIFTSWSYFWDSEHYLNIATKGYHFPDQAFFPLWPLLIKIFSIKSFNPFIVGYVLTIFLGFTNFVLFYLLAKKLVGNINAKWALILFAFFPGTIFLHASYSENIFLVTTLTSFLLLENKKYILSGLSGGFATASRMAGLALIAAILFIKTNFRRKFYMVVLSSLGLICYMLFLYINNNDPFYFVKGQLAWCTNAGRCGFTFPLSPLIDYIRLILSGKESLSIFSFRFNDWISSIIFLSLLPVVWKKLPFQYFIYSLVILLMPLSSGSTTSMLRIVMTVFPVFFILPDILKNKYIKIILSIVFILLQLRLVAIFTGYLWVA